MEDENGKKRGGGGSRGNQRGRAISGAPPVRVRTRPTRRRTVSVCAACHRIYKAVVPDGEDNGHEPRTYYRAGVCLDCRRVTRRWVLEQLLTGRRIEVT